MKTMNNEKSDDIGYCGVTCSYCYVHLREKQTCMGCKKDIKHPMKSCTSCKIKSCAKEKEIDLCVRCDDFPCDWIKKMDKSYRQRYDVSLIGDMRQLEKDGIDLFLKNQRNRYTCPKCKSVISMHDKRCFKCDG